MHMENVKVFLNFLRKFVTITDEEFEKSIQPVLKVRKFRKKEYLVKQGEIEHYFNFISKGIIRKYYKTSKVENNVQISTEGQVILGQQSFLSREPSEYYVEAIEPATVISIRHDKLEELYAQSKRMERLGRLVITHMMIVSDTWQMQMIKMTPRERFIAFVNKNPELMRRVPQKYLASYLNIKPETFSRFKHLLKNNPNNMAA